MELRDDHGCFGCSPDNPVGLHLDFQPDGEGGVVGRADVPEHFSGWRGVVHGGIVCAMLDEAMAKAAAAGERRMVTAELNVRLAKPLPTRTPVVISAKLAEERGRLVRTGGEIRVEDGQLYATGRATFLVARVPAEA